MPRWLQWAREIQALSQTGLAYSETNYNAQRYRCLAEIAAEMVQSHTALAKELKDSDLALFFLIFFFLFSACPTLP